jgi:gamma-polyglutamate biosynthesis protein CapA
MIGKTKTSSYSKAMPLFVLSAAFVAAFVSLAYLSTRGVIIARNELLPPKEIQLLLAGDMMFDRTVRQVAEEKGQDFLLSCVADTLKSADIVVANLEGPITQAASRSVGSKVGEPDNTTFTFPTSTATLLARHNIRAVSLGNNHIHNFGVGGMEASMRFLEEAGVGHFGDPLGERVYETTIDGVPLAFIGYNEFQSLERGGWEASTTTLEKVQSARSRGFLPIVFAHWGEEYVAANAEQKSLARAWIDAGAELVVGAHPHVVQEHEQYAGKDIYYSLGNFVFDQYFRPEVQKGLLLSVAIRRSGVKAIQEIPSVLTRDRRVCIE